MPVENRMQRTFARLESEGRKALVAYLCVGDPSEAESIDLARACLRAGADILELGVPFSDPSADGPAIARAGQRALAKGGGIASALRVARALRDESECPIVLFGYYNPIAIVGESKIVDEAKRSGVDALLVVDLPIEESGPLRDLAQAAGISVVPMVAPTSHTNRVAAVKEVSQKWPVDFVYYVSVAGVTGTVALRADDASRVAARLRQDLGLRVVVGFGIDAADKARAAAQGTDGVVVGTAIVRAIEDGTSAEDRIARVERLVRDIRTGVE